MNITKLAESQRSMFQTGQTLNVSFRIRQLQQLKKLAVTHQDEICDAIQSDFGKPRFEAYSTEILRVVREVDHHLKHIRKWTRPQRVKSSLITFPSRNRIYFEPYGTVLIIGAWNYPFNLVFQPLTGALTAGNTAILKPSEMAPETSGLIARLVQNYFDPDLLTVVEGDAVVAKELLKQSFDYIFFTGSEKTGKIVMKAAAEHLTPVTLELGGKSPAIVHRDADVAVAAKRIWWGKCMNSGQTCVAPDFVVIHRDLEDAFIRHSKSVLESFHSMDETEGASPRTKIVNDNHFRRLSELISQTEPLIGGQTNSKTRYIEPVLARSDWDGPLMKEEIFGPLLPLLVYDDVDDLIERLKAMPSPLAFYLFAKNRSVQQRFIRNIPFGGGCINDTFSHLGNHHLPYGGIGSSGMGSYMGRHSFETFSHKKSILRKPNWPDPAFRYPPYTQGKLNLIKRLFN